MARHDMAAHLARKYASQGPRYTSYPTAPQFTTDFPLELYQQWQQAQPRSDQEPLSLYVHIPFCHDICFYCGCNKQVTRKPGVARDYLDHLQQEVMRQSALAGRNRPITQMHWGGGTPTYLDDAEITELMHLLASHFNLLDKGYREYSIELDPRTINGATVALLKGLGFNRASLGIQDFDPLVQKSINRLQSFQQIRQLMDSIRAHNYRSISFDLIYGLPHQDQDTTRETLARVIDLRPDRIAYYNYAHLPERFPSQRSIDRLTLPTPEQKIAMQLQISETLQQAGYVFIGMDHYVLPDDDLALAQNEGRLQRNFQGYSLRLADDLLGLGVSAISQIGDYYLQNARDIPSYYAALAQGGTATERGCRINEDDRLRRYIIMSLISDLKLDMAEVNQLFGVDFQREFRQELQVLRPMAEDGLLAIDADSITITDTGRSFLRNICMPFDAYLKPTNPDAPVPKFSATV